MEQLYKKINIQPLAKVHDLYTSNLQQVKLVKNYKQMKIKENQVKIKEEHDKIDNMFNNQSIAIIQFLRSKNNNKYDIKQIKIKLKQYKKQQKQRILHIRNIYEQIKIFEKIIQKNQKNHIQQHDDKKQQIDELYEDIFNCQAKIEQMTTKKLKLQVKKEQLQNFINFSLSKWKQSDENKQKLQKLYTQLNKISTISHNIEQSQVEFEYTRNKLHSLHSFHSSGVKPQDQPFTTTTNNEQNNEIKSLKYQSKHNSVTSLHDSKSLLSLVNPIKRTANVSHQYTEFQPILSDCQMILSKKLSSRDLNNKETAQKQKQKRYPMQSRFQSNTFLKKTTQKNQKQTQKQNTIWSSRHSKTANNQKLSISSKATTSQNLPTAKGKLIQSQRISISNLLISKFNR